MPEMVVVKSPNFWPKRQGHKVNGIVVHITDGTFDGTIAWFKNKQSQASAHYVINRDGKIYEMVDPDDTAWHCGVVNGPTWKKYRKGVNPNLHTIGIEFVGGRNDRFSVEQYWSGIALIRELCELYELEFDSETVVNHRAINSAKTCPGIYNDANIMVECNRIIG